MGAVHSTLNRMGPLYARHVQASLLPAERQGDVSHEAAKLEIYHIDNYLYYRCYGGADNEKRSLRGASENGANRGGCFTAYESE